MRFNLLSSQGIKRLSLSVVSLLALGLATPLPAAAGESANPSFSTPNDVSSYPRIYPRMGRDFSHIVWMREVWGGGGAERWPAELVKRLQPWALAALKNYQDQTKTVNEPLTPENSCHPLGMPGYRYVQAHQFLITPEIALHVFSSGLERHIIYMNKPDGTPTGPDPKTSEPNWTGYPRGHWDGDTLVIETTGYNGLGQESVGILTTKQLRVTERYKLIDTGRKLEATLTYDDPGALTSPYTFTRIFVPFYNQEAWPEEYVCVEGNNRPVPMATKETAGKG